MQVIWESIEKQIFEIMDSFLKTGNVVNSCLLFVFCCMFFQK